MLVDTGGPPLGDGSGAVTRRGFLGRSAALAGGVGLVGASTARASRLLAAASHVEAAAAYAPVALTATELGTLQAVLGQLFPSDGLGAGAVGMGVDVYIDRALDGSYKSLLPVYQGLLPMFDKAAATMGAASFSGLSAAKQSALLALFEAGKAPGVSAADATAAAGSFQLLLEHMREGLFADPMYGGNRDLAGWRLIGYPDIQLVWTAGDQAIGAKLTATGKTAQSYGGKPYNGPPA